jgi:excisionase family DNA binding protein
MDRYLKPDQVAELLGIKKSTVHVWVHRKIIPYTKLANGTLRFSEKRLERWLEENSHE